MLRFQQAPQQRSGNGLTPLMWLRFLVFPLTLLAGLAGIGVLVLALVVALAYPNLPALVKFAIRHGVTTV